MALRAEWFSLLFYPIFIQEKKRQSDYRIPPDSRGRMGAFFNLSPAVARTDYYYTLAVIHSMCVGDSPPSLLLLFFLVSWEIEITFSSAFGVWFEPEPLPLFLLCMLHNLFFCDWGEDTWSFSGGNCIVLNILTSGGPIVFTSTFSCLGLRI